MSDESGANGPETSRRELLRKGAAATGASAAGLAAFSGESLAGCVCPRSPGFWKKHWPSGVNTITIDGCTLNRNEAQQILKRPKRGNKCQIMLFHLIAAKLNKKSRAPSCTAATQAIGEAEKFVSLNNCIDGNCNVGSTRRWGGYESVKDTLDAYNNDRLCNCPH